MRQLHMADMEQWIETLEAGEEILLSGCVYTARDAAHKRIIAALDAKETLPFPLSGAAVYYAGPTPAKNGLAVGSAGPTTSSRMDPFLPRLAALGLRLTIGKGDRSPAVYDAIRACRGAYLAAIGGAGALAASHIISSRVIAYPELGCESVKEMIFSDFPLFVAIDARGNSVFAR